MLTSRDKFREKAKRWISFYRHFPHEFVKDFLNIDLTFYQSLALYQMSHYDNYTLITARGLGKTFVTAIFCVVMCVLYPGIKIVISSGTVKQANLTLLKIKNEIYPSSELLQREIKSSDMTIINDGSEWNFENGSTIQTVTSSDTARGARANILIVDEYRTVDFNIFRDVLYPTLAAQRNPRYTSKTEYKHLKNTEPNKTITLSSGWYQYHWSWEEFKKNINMYASTARKAAVLGLPYQFGIKDGVVTLDTYENAKARSSGDIAGWMMEYGAMFYSQSQSSVFRQKDLNELRLIPQAVYPREVLGDVDLPDLEVKPRGNGEFNVVCCDPAFAGGEGDYTAYTIINVVPSKGRYLRRVIYEETTEGGVHTNTANRIRQLYYDYDCSYIVLDVASTGRAIYNELAEEDDSHYTKTQGFMSMNNDALANSSREINPYAKENIFTVYATQEIRRLALTALMDSVGNRRIHFLATNIVAEEYLMGLEGFGELSDEQQAALLNPFVETNALLYEMSAVETEGTGTTRKIKHKSRRDDRYTSLSYGNYFINLKEREYIAETNKTKRGNSNFVMLVN